MDVTFTFPSLYAGTRLEIMVRDLSPLNARDHFRFYRRDSIAFLYVWEAALEELEPQQQVADFMNRPGGVKLDRFINVNEASLRDIVNSEVERQVGDHLNDSIPIVVEETFTDAIHQATDSVASQEKSNLNGFIEVSLCRVIESG